MISKLVRKYLEKSPETLKARMKQPHKVIRITRTRPEDRVAYYIPTMEAPAPHLIPYDESPTEEDPTGTVNNVFLFSRIGGQIKGNNIHVCNWSANRHLAQCSSIFFSIPMIMVITTSLQKPS